MSIKSALRYPGGKSKIAKQLFDYFPSDLSDYNIYAEPFLGGGSVFFHTYNALGDHLDYWLSDASTDLICFWVALRDHPKELYKAIFKVKSIYPNGKELFSLLSHRHELTRFSELHCNDFLYQAVRYFILNRITFSGAVDAAGFSKSAFEKRFTDSSIERMFLSNAALRGANIQAFDYETAFGVLNNFVLSGKRVFSFLDPPYYSAKNSGLYGKRGELHKGFDHGKLSILLKASRFNWLMTYDDSEYIRSLYPADDFEIISWDVQYGMNNVNKNTAPKGAELIIKKRAQ